MAFGESVQQTRSGLPRVPQEGGRVQGWDRYVEGWLDSPISKFEVTIFKISKFQCLRDHKFQSSKNSKMNSNKSRYVGHAFPNKSTSSDLKCLKRLSFTEDYGFPWIIWSVLVSPKIDNISFGAQGHDRKSRNHRNEGFEGSHTSKSKSYKIKLKQNCTTEL